jgi:translation initiation factor IF-2
VPKKKPSVKSTRPPIVTIMGHVDHGKTTLLDTIRHSHITDTEHGGITQHIGAYQIEVQGKKITFIDTPGHAAFTNMRSRGAHITDLVVLVVAANDGVKPQTVESIKHIKQAGVPLIVAINKIDVTGASSDMVRAQLTEYGVFVEGYGGQTPVVEISALQKQGIDELLELILLSAEMEEIVASPTNPLSAIVIESKIDKNLGSRATVIVKDGQLNVGDSVFIGSSPFKVRLLLDDAGKKINQALPGDPVVITGFKSMPSVGSVITSKPITTQADLIVPEDSSELAANTLRLIIKADANGTLEAIIGSIKQPEIELIGSSIGPVVDSDVLLAQATKSFIIAFNVNVTSSAKKLAQIEKVNIETFNIIYKLLEFLEEKVLKIIEPTINEIEVGTAEVITRFDIRGEIIAGCKVSSGKIFAGNLIHLSRKDKIVADAKVKSLKSGKQNLKEAKAGTECGITFEPELDIKTGDVLKSYRIEK